MWPCRVLVWVALLCGPHAAAAQTNVGSGPLTGSLADTEPTAGNLRVGPIKLAPGIVIPEFGWDSNVFEEETNPDEDIVLRVLPEVGLFTSVPLMRFSGYVGGEFVYFRKFEQERYIGYTGRGRVDFLLKKVRPFLAGGKTLSRTRPNGELEVRADYTIDELSGGLAYDHGPNSTFYVAAYRSGLDFYDAFNEGIALGLSLDRVTYNYSVGMRTDVTPLTSLTLSGSVLEERFKFAPSRDSESYVATGALKFGSEAVATGVVSLSYRDYKPVDPAVARYRGVSGNAEMVFPVAELGRFSLGASRTLEHSYDIQQGYFMDNTISLSYTHRLFYNLDAQVRGAKSAMEYGFRASVPERRDTQDIVGGGIGYNLRNRSRVSANYEFLRRRSLAVNGRNYDRQRVFLSWTYQL